MQPESQVDDSHVILVTGATGAIGKAIARQLAAHPTHSVVLAVRDEKKGRRTVKEIRERTGNDRVRLERVDLARRASVEALVSRWQGPLHVLVNNAGATPRRREETPEGIERQFATNVLGYFWMMHHFSDVLKESAPSRVVNVASYWAGDLDLDDLEFSKRPYTNGRSYRQSKQADRMLTVAFARRLEPFGVGVHACHPGDVNSTLSNNLGFGGHESPDQGAQTPVWLATKDRDELGTGRYYESMRPVRCRFGEDLTAVEALYQKCLTYV